MASVSEHCVVTIGDVAYYLRDRIEKTIDLGGSGNVTPAVVVTLSCPELSVKHLEDTFAEFQDRDDVFQAGFVDGAAVIVQLSDGVDSCDSDPVSEYLHSRSSTIHFSPSSKSSPSIPDGPYFARRGSLHQAWRLYEDELDSFVSAVVPADDGDEARFKPLPVSAYSGTHAVVAVPSRLYSPPMDDKPLNGKRITVKDNYNLAGAVTTMGSRSYTAYYGFQNETSLYVKELLAKGAVIVGKTKMGAYTGSEAPPDKSIDYLPPFNPRGDGYQGPSGSSMGAGSSIAGYDWVDISLGTDTTGSIRMPAASYGVWGLRVTPNSPPFSLQGVVPSVPPFDTPGILSRTSREILSLYSAAGESICNNHEKPSRILYPTDFFPMQDASQQAMQEEFLGALENYLDVKHEKISLDDEWSKTGPPEHKNTPLREYMKKSGYWPNFYDGYHVYDDFRAGYQDKFGKKVYTSPFMTTRWQRGIDTTQEQRDQGLRECSTVAEWLFSEMLTPETIILIPVGRPGANYRDVIPEPGRGGPPDTAFSPMYLPTALGVPHLIVPIGQNPFESRASGRTEYAPIVGSIIGARGTDTMLLSVAQAALEHAGWPSEVMTGRFAFAVGDNTRHAVIASSRVDTKL